MPVDGPSYLVGRTDEKEKVLNMFWSSTNYRCLWTGPENPAKNVFSALPDLIFFTILDPK